jgi:hypothetical protein
MAKSKPSKPPLLSWDSPAFSMTFSDAPRRTLRVDIRMGDQDMAMLMGRPEIAEMAYSLNDWLRRTQR